MARPEPRQVVVAREAFVGTADGIEYAVRQGEPFESDHPLVKKFPDLFQALRFRYPVRDRVETATAAPGEKRG